MAWAVVVVGAASLGYGIYQSEHKKNLAKKAGKANVRPTYQIQEPVYDNQRLALSQAGQGISTEGRQLYTDNADRAMSSSLDTLLKAGGGLNSVSELYGQYGDNLKGLVGLDNELRFKNQQVLMSQNERLSQEYDKEFQLNHWSKFADEAQRIAELRGQAAASEQAAISGAFSTAGSLTGRQRKEKSTSSSYGIIDTNMVDTPSGRMQGVDIPQNDMWNYDVKNTNYLLDGY